MLSEVVFDLLVLGGLGVMYCALLLLVKERVSPR